MFITVYSVSTHIPPETAQTTYSAPITHMDVSTVPSNSSGISPTPIPVNTDIHFEVSNSDDECVLGLRDIHLSDDAEEKQLSIDVGVSQTATV